MGEQVIVAFGPNAQLLVREQSTRGTMLVMCTSEQKKRKVLLAALTDPALVATLDGLFVGIRGAPPDRPHAAQNAGAVRTAFDAVEFWTMPRWYAQALARVAQDAFRLHALFSASSPTVTHPLLVDRVLATRTKATACRPSRLRFAVKFHGSSGGCVCAAHGLAPSAPFAQLELRFEVCGHATTRVRGRRAGACPVHPSAEEADATESPIFPGVCAQEIRVTLLCKHGDPGAVPDPEGLALPLSLLVVDGALRPQWLHAPLMDLLCCGARLLAPGACVSTVACELRAQAQECLQDFHMLCAEQLPRPDELQLRDEAVVALLRSGSIVLTTRGRFEHRRGVDASTTQEKRRLAKLANLVPTHGHLFRIASRFARHRIAKRPCVGHKGVRITHESTA